MGRVWIYIISKALSDGELKDLQLAGENFVRSWTTHDLQLTASFEIYKSRIIIVKVNESIQSASGCSTDKLSRFIKECEGNFKIELLNRMLIAVKKNEDLEIMHANQIPNALNEGIMNENSIVLNTAASDWEQLKNWEQPLSGTWLKKYLVSK